MAASDARPVPIKNTAYRLYFVALTTAGVRVTAFTSPDSEVSKDGGIVTDCTNEATFVGRGRGYIDLTSTEMNADHVGFSFTCTEGTADVELYPQETGDILVSLSSSGMDAVLVESSISAGAGLTNDTGTQLTSINARQALALIASACAGVLSGAAGTDIDVKPAGKPAGNTRIDAAFVDANGNRSTVNLKVPD